jgi:D-xylose transport system permease protein
MSEENKEDVTTHEEFEEAIAYAATVEQDTADVAGVVIAESPDETFSDVLADWWRRVKVGDLGSLPIIIGLILIGLIFYILEPLFFSPRNFVNLLLQMAGVTTIAIGVVFVLLIGEIDLSIGYVSAVAGVMTVLLLRLDGAALPWPAAIGIALVSVALIGLLQGWIITRTGAHSFVVTLAGLLVWSGVVLIMTTVYSTAGTIVIQDEIVVGIANTYLPPLWGWALWGITNLVFIFSRVSRYRSLKRQNLSTGPVSLLVLSILAVALVTGFAVWFANQDRGVPVVFIIVLFFLLFWTIITTRTKFGRYIYAVGGNQEAARRAGINVNRIRVMVFMITSFMAGVGGIILASRLRSVDTATGGGNLMLNAIAAAVIGGTSLFGGVGFVMSALLGGLIIAAVENGMGLLGLPSGVKFVVNGLVLLAAVLIDALSRRRRESSGIV